MSEEICLAKKAFQAMETVSDDPEMLAAVADQYSRFCVRVSGEKASSLLFQDGSSVVFFQDNSVAIGEDATQAMILMVALSAFCEKHAKALLTLLPAPEDFDKEYFEALCGAAKLFTERSKTFRKNILGEH